MTPETKRKQEESIDDYLIRLGENLELYGLNWSTASSLLNQEAEDEYTESKWRKDYAGYLRWKERLVKTVANSDEYIKDIEDRTIELQKEKFRFQDQKREFTNVVRQQARFEHLKQEIFNAILELSKTKPLTFEKRTPTLSKVKANVLWSDWHIGSDFSNSLNTYNLEVFRSRVENLVSEVIATGKKHDVSELTIANLGDMISGAIHVSTRVQSSEDVIRQIQIAAETIAECVAKLANEFDKIKLINIIGNHSRLIPNKTESLFKENLEYLIPWYLETRLFAFHNVQICKDTDGYFIDYVDGQPHIYVHGDLDHVSSAAKSLPQMLGIVPKYIFCGHIHHDTVKEYGRTKVISNGSLVGIDDYAISKRFFAEPMQKMHIFDGSRIKCTYDFELK